MSLCLVERRFRASRPKRCQPAPERGPGGFRMGRTQPHGIAGHHGPAASPIFNVNPANDERLFRTRRPTAAQPAPRRPARGQRGLAERLRAELWRAHDFGGYVPRFGSKIRGLGRSLSVGGEPVAIVDLIRGGLGCSLTRCSLAVAY